MKTNQPEPITTVIMYSGNRYVQFLSQNWKLDPVNEVQF